jgi:hypothetical protein
MGVISLGNFTAKLIRKEEVILILPVFRVLQEAAMRLSNTMLYVAQYYISSHVPFARR